MRKLRLILLIALPALLFGCSKHNDIFEDMSGGGSNGSSPRETTPTRSVTEETRRVLIMYSAGYNNLTYALEQDLNDIANAYVPTGYKDSNVLLVISRLAKSSYDFTTPSAPILVRFTREEGKETVRDTIKIWDQYTAVTSPEFMSEALRYVKKHFPAASYGMIFSSHGSGWLPARYYSNPDKYDPDAHVDDEVSLWSAPERRNLRQEFSPFGEFPGVKSLGQDDSRTAQNPYSELEMPDLARAISIHLDYLILDACLMGSVEFAYELKDKCNRIVFSPAEVLSDGFPYDTMVGHLLGGAEADVEAVCRDYFDHYFNQTSSLLRSATVSLVDCSKLDDLADVCAGLFAKYQTTIRALNPNLIQHYYRFNRHFFYDLKDILIQCNLTDSERASLQEALDACVIYKAATPTFLYGQSGWFYINTGVYSGLSMYLPASTTGTRTAGTPYLDSYYKENISWNKRTGLVQ